MFVLTLNVRMRRKMKDKTIVFLMVFCLAVMSCAVKTTITEPSGEQFVVESKSDGFVTYEEAGRKVIVDNRGKRSLLEDLMGIFTLRFMREDEDD
jgi:hypothetical protein